MKHPLPRSFATLVVLLGSIALSACGGGGDCSGPLCGGGSTGPTSNPPGAPGNVAITVSGTTITVTWSAGSRATSHRVNLTTPGEEARSQTVGGTATNASFDGLTQTRTYTGQVIAINSDGETAGGSAQALVPAITGAVRARARVDGELVPNFPVSLIDVAADTIYDVNTDSSGVFIFRDLEPGAYEVYVSPTLDFFSFPAASHTVDVAAGVVSDAIFFGTADISQLKLGSPVTGLSGATRSVRWFHFDVTASALADASAKVVVTLSGGTGDVDLLVVDPNLTTSASETLTNEEGVRMDAVVGQWHVLVYGFSAFAGVTLRTVQE